MRNLVVCCDGTWNTPTQKDRGVAVHTNVVKMSLATSGLPHQLMYYGPGVGSGGVLDKLTGGALGIGLTRNIQQAYAWLAEHLRPDDRLFLFGFSRGAYTVRSLAGLIGRCGLTAPDAAQVDHAYALYRKAGSEEGRQRAAAFRANQRTPDIHFLGVWDTVGALGVPAVSRYGLLRKTVRLLTDNTVFAHGFHDETLGSHVMHAYQALAIDERRGAFQPSLWQAGKTPRAHVEQAWFAGAHSNVGGGYVDAGLSDHAFMWMAAKAMDAGLRVNEHYVAKRVNPHAHGELRSEHHGLYKLMPEHVREIGLASALNEGIHVSVLQRMDDPGNDYRPPNVRRDTLPPLATDGPPQMEAIRRRVIG